MKDNIQIMSDRPEIQTAIISLFYCVAAFWILPFVLLLLLQGSLTNAAARSGVEIAYHIFNFIASCCLFASYMKESFLNVQLFPKNFWATVGIGVAVTLVTALICFGISLSLPGDLSYTSDAILPRGEMELFCYGSTILYYQPILGTVVMVLLAPISTSCLYYATVFAPSCKDRPWIAYVLIIVFTAIPRLCNGLTYWVLEEEIALYFLHLPMHLIACRVYQKADTIWAPIAVQAITNLLGCIFFLVLLSVM